MLAANLRNLLLQFFAFVREPASPLRGSGESRIHFLSFHQLATQRLRSGQDGVVPLLQILHLFIACFQFLPKRTNVPFRDVEGSSCLPLFGFENLSSSERILQAKGKLGDFGLRTSLQLRVLAAQFLKLHLSGGLFTFKRSQTLRVLRVTTLCRVLQSQRIGKCGAQFRDLGPLHCLN